MMTTDIKITHILRSEWSATAVQGLLFCTAGIKACCSGSSLASVSADVCDATLNCRPEKRALLLRKYCEIACCSVVCRPLLAASVRTLTSECYCVCSSVLLGKHGDHDKRMISLSLQEFHITCYR